MNPIQLSTKLHNAKFAVPTPQPTTLPKHSNDWEPDVCRFPNTFKVPPLGSVASAMPTITFWPTDSSVELEVPLVKYPFGVDGIHGQLPGATARLEMSNGAVLAIWACGRQLFPAGVPDAIESMKYEAVAPARLPVLSM